MSRKPIVVIGALVLGLAIVLLALMFVLPSMMTPAKTSPSMLAEVPPKGPVSVVGQIIEINGEVLSIEILEGNGYDVFDTRTGVYLQAEYSPEVEIVMGQTGDVETGAIAQFDGTKLADGSIRLSRIVILTGYVTGPAEP